MVLDQSLSTLRVFEAAARTRSLKLAAADLSVTPRAVSHAVRKLERDLGTTLFARTGRSVTLTHEGSVLPAHVERGFAELRRGLEVVARETPRPLCLHAAPSFAAQWLAPRLPRFLAAHPRVEVRLASGTDYGRFDACDADIVYGERPPDAEAICLGDEVVSPLRTAAVAARIASVDDLMRVPLIESDNKRVRWRDWFAANGRERWTASASRWGPCCWRIASWLRGGSCDRCAGGRGT